MDSIIVPISASIGGLKTNLNQAYGVIDKFALYSNSAISNISVGLNLSELQSNVKEAKRNIKKLALPGDKISNPLKSASTNIVDEIKDAFTVLNKQIDNTKKNIEGIKLGNTQNVVTKNKTTTRTSPRIVETIKTRLDNTGTTQQINNIQSGVASSLNEIFVKSSEIVGKNIQIIKRRLEKELNPSLLLKQWNNGTLFKKITERLTAPFVIAQNNISQSFNKINRIISINLSKADKTISNTLKSIFAFVDSPDQKIAGAIKPLFNKAINWSEGVKNTKINLDISSIIDPNAPEKIKKWFSGISSSTSTQSDKIAKTLTKFKTQLSSFMGGIKTSYDGTETGGVINKSLSTITSNLNVFATNVSETISEPFKKGWGQAVNTFSQIQTGTSTFLNKLKKESLSSGKQIATNFSNAFLLAKEKITQSYSQISKTVALNSVRIANIAKRATIKTQDFLSNPDGNTANAIQPFLDKAIDWSKGIKTARKNFDRRIFFDETVPKYAEKWATSISDAVSGQLNKIGDSLTSFKNNVASTTNQIFTSYNKSQTGSAINKTASSISSNTGVSLLARQGLKGADQLKKGYDATIDAILNRLAIVGKAEKGTESLAGLKFYSTVFGDIKKTIGVAFNSEPIKEVAMATTAASVGFVGLSRNVKGLYNNTALTGNSLKKLASNVFDVKNNFEGFLTASIFLGQFLASNVLVQVLTPLGDIQQYLIGGLIPNLGTVMQMLGIINKYSAGPLLMQARYANIVKQLAIAEKVLVGMTNSTGQVYSSFKGIGLVMKTIVVPAKLGLQLLDLVNTLNLFNMQLQMAVTGLLTLGDNLVNSAGSLLSGQGFLMPGAIAPGPTAANMFQIDQGIESAVNFDQMLMNFNAVMLASGSSKEEINSVTEELLRLSEQSALPFQIIADGLTEMARSAYTLDEIRQNFQGLSNAAITTGVGLQEVVGGVNSVARDFGLTDLNVVSNVLAKLSALTGVTITEVSSALSTLQPVAAETRTSFEDLSVFIGSLTDTTGKFSTQSVSSIIAIYSAIQKASAGDKEKLNILEQLGISKSDIQIADGVLKPIDKVILTIREKVSKARDEGVDIVSSLSGLIGGGEGVRKQTMLQVLGVGADTKELTKKIESVKKEIQFAQKDISEAADEQNNSFNGQLQRLVNATFSVSVAVGRMFQPLLQMWIDGALTIASWFNNWNSAVQKFGIALQALIPLAIVYFKVWLVHFRLVEGLGLAYKLMFSLLKAEGRAEFVQNLTKDLAALKLKILDVAKSGLDVLSGKTALKDSLQSVMNFIGDVGKANMDEFIGTTMKATKSLLMPVDALGRWAGSLTRVNVSLTAVTDSLVSMGRQMVQLGKEGAEFATWQSVGAIGSIKKRLSGIDVGKERMTNAYKMTMGYGAETMPTIDGKNVYETMNFAQNMALLAVQIGLVYGAWYTLTELFKRSEGAKVAEETRKLNKELQETYKTTGLIAKDKSLTDIGKGIFSSVGSGFGKIQEFYSKIDILTPLENQLGKFEKSLENTQKKDFTPKVAPIEQTITAKQAGKAVLDLFVDSRKGPTTRPVDPTNLRLGAVTFNKASTQDFTNKLNKLIVQSFVIQQTNAIRQWASGIKNEVALGLVRGAKTTVGFINEMKSFVNNLGTEVGKFKDQAVTGLIDGVKNLYEGTADYIKKIKEVGLVEASREKLSADPTSSFGNDASVSGMDIAEGLGKAAGSMTGLLIAASVLGITLNPLGLIIAGLASAFVGLSGAMDGAFKTMQQAGNIQSMLAKDELLKTTDLALESSQDFLNKYGIANKANLLEAKDKLTAEQKAEVEAGVKSQIENLQSAINTLEKTKSSSPEEKAITETRIKLYQDEVNRLRHREGVIKGTIQLNEKLVYSYKELNDQIAQMNYARELGNSFTNAKYEKRLVEDPDKLINGERVIAKERAKMREDEIRGNIKALAEEKRKLTERTSIAPRNEEEAKEYEAAKKRLFEIDLDYNRQVGDLAKAQQDEMKRISQERVDDEIAKFNKLNSVLKQETTQKEIGNEFAFGVGDMDKDTYADNQSKIRLDSLRAEKKLAEDELQSFIQLNKDKDFSNKDLAQKKIELEQKISDSTLQIIEERNKQELELVLRNIRVIAAEKTRALQNEARGKEFDENDLNRRSEVASVVSDIEQLSLERGQRQLEYQLQIAELMKDETKAIQLREQLYASQLNMKLAEIEAQKELLALQSEAKMVSAERTAIESELAVVEAESALAEAIANKETEDVLARLEDELSYKQRLVENAYQNISSTQTLAELEQEKLNLAGENEIATIKETRAVEQLKAQTEASTEAKEKELSVIDKINKQLKEQESAYKQLEGAKKLANQQKLLGLVGTGGFDIASTLMDNEMAVSSLGNEISLLQSKLEQLNSANTSAGENKEVSEAILETEKELADKVLEKQLVILGQQIEFKKQLTTEIQLQLKAMEENIAIMERLSELEVARNQEVKARLDYYTALLDIQKQISDKVLPTLETGDIDSLLEGLKAQEALQKRIDLQRIETLRVEHRIALSNLAIEERKANMSAQRQRAELRNNVLLARDAVLQADQSGDTGAIAVARQQLDIANQALSNFEHQESLNQQINRSKRATLETENKSLMVQEKANQKAESFTRQQEKINAISRNITNEIDKQQKKMQSIADLNKAIYDYRISTLERESSQIDSLIGMRKELSNQDSEMPDTLRRELTLQMESMKAGSSTQSEKSLYQEKVNIEQRLAKERMKALLAEQAMERAMFSMETKKLGLEMRTAEMQAKIIAMQAKGTELEKPANDLVRESQQAMFDFEKDRATARESLTVRQEMDRESLQYDNTSKINEARRTMAEAGYKPEGDPAKFKPSDYIVPALVSMDKSLKQVDKSILKFEEVGTALDTFNNSLEGLAQRIDQIQSPTLSVPSPANNPKQSNPNGPGGPGGSNTSGTVINVDSVTVISSDPTGDARKVLTDLTKANNSR